MQKTINIPTGLLKELGLQKAIILSQIIYFYEQNKATNNQSAFKGGKYWWYGSYKFLEGQVFLSKPTIIKYIAELEELGYIEVIHSKPKGETQIWKSQVNWYRPKYEKLYLIDGVSKHVHYLKEYFK